MPDHRLSPSEARRLAVRAQLLDAHRPVDLVSMVTDLTLLQIDPTAAIAPNADLVCWTRLGATYRPTDLTEALETQRTLFELNARIRPMSDLRLYLADMHAPPSYEEARAWLVANDRFRTDVLALLDSDGPLLSRDIPDTAQQPWGSTGWTNDRNVTQMLEILMMQGEVAVAARRGRQRLWDVARRVYPPDVEVIPQDEAVRIRNARRLKSLGIARSKTTKVPVEPWDVGDTGDRAVVEGVPGEWRVDGEWLDRVRSEPFEGRTALLSPFDRLVHDRKRAEELFGFEYVLEMYKPKQDRKWGYFALPILHGDRLVGKLDARADRKAGALEVYAIHQDVPFSSGTEHDVAREIRDLAEWLGLEPRGL